MAVDGADIADLQGAPIGRPGHRAPFDPAAAQRLLDMLQARTAGAERPPMLTRTRASALLEVPGQTVAEARGWPLGRWVALGAILACCGGAAVLLMCERVDPSVPKPGSATGGRSVPGPALDDLSSEPPPTAELASAPRVRTAPGRPAAALSTPAGTKQRPPVSQPVGTVTPPPATAQAQVVVLQRSRMPPASGEQGLSTEGLGCLASDCATAVAPTAADPFLTAASNQRPPFVAHSADSRALLDPDKTDGKSGPSGLDALRGRTTPAFGLKR